MNESSTPTALVKVFGDFESRVKTASRRNFDSRSSFGRHPSGSSYSSAFKQTSATGNRMSHGGLVSSALRGRLNFDSPKKRTSSVLDDPLTGFERYPKAVKSEDNRQMQSEMEHMKIELIQKDADNVSLEAEIKQKEALMKKMEIEIQKDRLLRENEREKMVRQNRNDNELIEDLKAKINRLTKRREHNAEYDEMRPLRDRNRDSIDHQNEVERLTEELILLRDQVYEVRTEKEHKEMEYQEQILTYSNENSELKEQLKLKDEQKPTDSSELQKELEKAKGDLGIAQQEIKRLESELKTVEEDKIQQRIMKKKLDNYARMEKSMSTLKNENKLLNDTADNSQLLKEQIEDLKERLTKSEECLAESRQKQESLFFAERQLNQWKSICYRLLSTSERSKYGNDFGPDILSAKISDLQQELLAKSDEIEVEKSNDRAKDHQIKTIQDEVEKMNEKSSQDKLNLTEANNLIKRFKRKLLLVSKERDSYKGVLESYEHELTFTGAAFEKDRVSALENSLKDYRETVERLEELLSEARSTRKDSNENQALRQEVENLTAKIEALEREKINAVQSLYDQPSGSKVLHFLNNPLQQSSESRKQDFNELKTENTALKARIQLLEEGQTKDLTLLVGHKLDEGTSSEEVKDLKDQLKAAEIRKQRLIEAFKKTSQDFREVAYRLTGMSFII